MNELVTLPPSQKVLTTARLLLRPLRQEDAAPMTSLADDWEVAHMTGRIPYPYTLVEADAWIASLAEDEFVRGIERSGELIGVCGYVIDEDGAPEIGYWLGRSHWGQGYATEAARALIAHCFGDADFKRIVCCHFVENTASQRVIEKLGFQRLGSCISWSEARQCDAPALRYELTRTWARYLARRAA
jgi:RimJ/RimL family protein N-acetyltransferase